MREIPVTRGLAALVDDEDYDAVVALGRWHAVCHGLTFYARRIIADGGHRKLLAMHTFLTGWPMVDHINGNGLDNQRLNLRPATSQQNAMNRRVRSDSASGIKGVRQWHGGWRAQILIDGRIRHLGCFDSAEAAARAYDAAALIAFGEFARLNYPA